MPLAPNQADFAFRLKVVNQNFNSKMLSAYETTIRSVYTNSGYEQYVRLDADKLHTRRFVVNVTFTGHKVYYFRIIQSNGNIIRSGEIKRNIL